MTKVTKDNLINNILYDNYGNIIQTDKASLTYNSRNLMDSYTISNNEKYDFFYNYKGIRYKKVKESDYTVNYYLDDRRIIGEDVKDSNDEVQRKFRYFYDESGICGINYIVNNTNNYFTLIKDSLGNVSKVMNKGKTIGEYIYDAWRKCETVIFNKQNESNIEKMLLIIIHLDINVIIMI